MGFVVVRGEEPQTGHGPADKCLLIAVLSRADQLWVIQVFRDL